MIGKGKTVAKMAQVLPTTNPGPPTTRTTAGSLAAVGPVEVVDVVSRAREAVRTRITVVSAVLVPKVRASLRVHCLPSRVNSHNRFWKEGDMW